MKFSQTTIRAFALWAGLAAVLLGCNASRSYQALPSSAPPLMRAPLDLATDLSAHASWMAEEARNADLLYVSNVNTVTVYTYPKGKHVGTLRGFDRPQWECADNKGDVFITQADAVLEYAHGGTKQIEHLSMPGYYAAGCASDPMTGDLAVTWDYGRSHGYVGVYHNGSGTPALYTKRHMLFFWCGYDNAGNLFVDGAISPHAAVVELPKSGTKLDSVSLHETFSENPGAVQWDGKHLAIGDQANDTIYRFSIAGSQGKLVGKTALRGAQFVIQWWIEDGRLVGAYGLKNKVLYWPYPGGGSPTKAITNALLAPAGVTISKAPS